MEIEKRPDMVAGEQPEVEDLKPRSYQEQLYEICMKQNTIIYLPTGSGKTYIALLVLKRMAIDLTKPLAEGGKRSIFLVNTTVLARQQANYIKRVTSLQTAVYTGDMNLDNWKGDKWTNEFEKNQVLVATVQIILDVIRHGFLTVSNINLIIFDECHHATKNHPMHELMAQFDRTPRSEHPRVIGLSGMLIRGRVRPVEVISRLENLEVVFNGVIKTVGNFGEYENVLLYSTAPKELLLRYQDNTVKLGIIQRIEVLVCQIRAKIENWPKTQDVILDGKVVKHGVVNPRKELMSMFTQFMYQFNDLGVYGGSLAILSIMIDLELKKRNFESVLNQNLVRSLLSDCDFIRNILTDHMSDGDTVRNTILLNSTPKVLKLILFLEKMLAEKKSTDIKGLIFVDRRLSAKCLYHILKNFNEEIPTFDYRVDFIVGANNTMPESIECVLQQKWQRNVIDKFKRNETNLIIATSVLEEGIDLQMCNLVIVYDKFKQYGSYVQMKGRARMVNSTFVIMAESQNEREICRGIAEYNEIDKILKNYLIGKTINRLPPGPEKSFLEFNSYIKPFFTKNVGAVLEAGNVCALLNRYCMSLPNDLFGSARAIWVEVERSPSFIITLEMPKQSPLAKSFMSDPMPTIRLARCSAAFKACKMLYEFGELSENLLPITKQQKFNEVIPFYFSHWDKHIEDNTNGVNRTVGTKQNKRRYSVKLPNALVASNNHEEFHFYVLDIKTDFDENAQNDKVFQLFYQSNGSQHQIGILTPNPLPPLAEIDLFVSSGRLRCAIKDMKQKVSYNKNAIDMIWKFQTVLMKDLLGAWQSFLVQSRMENTNRLFIIPLNMKMEINIALIEQFQQLPVLRVPGDKLEHSTLSRPEEYIGSVVAPWYRYDENTKYVVISVRTDLSPNSQFPSKNNFKGSYAEYFEQKYQCVVRNRNQFLIEVRAISRQYDYLHSKKMNSKKLKFDDVSLILIPELCHNLKFPNELWMKATLLPSILHRINYLLLAEEIRIQMNKFLGLTAYPYKPKAVTLDYLKLAEEDADELEDSIGEPAKKNTVANCMAMPFENAEIRKITDTDLVSLSDLINNMKVADEPMDYDRNWKKVKPIDLDYYNFYVNRPLSALEDENRTIIALDETGNCETSNLRLNYKVAIESSEHDPSTIKLLSIKLYTNVIGPEQSDILAALTTKSASDSIDLERYEIIGDAFLKFSTSLYLLKKHSNWNEGYLTFIKSRLVSNRNLLYHGIDLNLPAYMKTIKFTPSNNWVQPSFMVPQPIKDYIIANSIGPYKLCLLELTNEEIEQGGIFDDKLKDFKENNKEPEPLNDSPISLFLGQQCISDKAIADCFEALIGVCVTSAGPDRTFLLLHGFNVLPIDVTKDTFEHILHAPIDETHNKKNPSLKEVNQFLVNAEQLEEKLNYQFKNRALLLQALTHPSYVTNRITGCYQQLEFLGDAVLDFLISSFIFERCVYLDPGKITDLRSALVNNITLACLCVRYNFHKYILYYGSGLEGAIENFVEFQMKSNYQISHNIRYLIGEDNTQMADCVDVPKILGDVFESIIGAVFIDSGNSLEITWSVIYHLMSCQIMEFMRDTPKQILRELYEFPGAGPRFSPSVEDQGKFMVSLKVTYRNEILEVYGFGDNTEAAKIAAAKLALNKLKHNR